MRLQFVWIPGVFCHRGLSRVVIMCLGMNFGGVQRMKSGGSATTRAIRRAVKGFCVFVELNTYEAK